jgi:hypothetical protein
MRIRVCSGSEFLPSIHSVIVCNVKGTNLFNVSASKIPQLSVNKYEEDFGAEDGLSAGSDCFRQVVKNI